MGSHYDILGVGADATDEEITDQYRALAKIVHPDVGGDAVMFDVLSDSYAVLSDHAQKVSYDAELATIVEASTAAGVPCRASRYSATLEGAYTPPSSTAGWRDRRSTPEQRRQADELAKRGIRSSHQTPGDFVVTSLLHRGGGGGGGPMAKMFAAIVGIIVLALMLGSALLGSL